MVCPPLPPAVSLQQRLLFVIIAINVVIISSPTTPPPRPPRLLPDLHTHTHATDASRPQMTVTAAYSSPILFMSHNASVYLCCPLSLSLPISLSLSHAVCPSECTVPQQLRFVNRGHPVSLPPPATDLHQAEARGQNHCDQMIKCFSLGGGALKNNRHTHERAQHTHAHKQTQTHIHTHLSPHSIFLQVNQLAAFAKKKRKRRRRKHDKFALVSRIRA